MSGQIYFVSGIDTCIGKTYTTGYLAKLWFEQGQNVITQKLIQTGNDDVSEDIECIVKSWEEDGLLKMNQN